MHLPSTKSNVSGFATAATFSDTLWMTCPRILTAFRQYEAETRWEVARWERDYARLPPAHRQLLSGQPAKFTAVRRHT